jgi:poly-gamma-glutamate capsule biosynthesis protein CapA/YwtB (metallophosphatase superfamily)
MNRSALFAGVLFLAGNLAGPEAAAEKAASSAAVTVAAVGDIMLGTDFPKNHLADDDGVSLLEEAAPILRSADITFGNLEGVLMDGGEPVKKCQNPNACYLFRSPTRYADLLADAGFDVMSLANNHARDFGEEGRDSSMAALAARGIRHSGRDGDVASWTVNGLTVAMIAFAPFKNSHDFLDTPLAAGLVRDLANAHDILIVSMHAGAEGGNVLHVPFQEEESFGERRGDVALFARTMVDHGADLVIGHGPHVPRGLEVHGNRLIAYSLGNFATYYGIRVTEEKGLAPLLVVEMDAEGRFTGGQVHSFRQLRPRGPVADRAGEAARLMERLSAADFPMTGPVFLEDGVIAPRPDGAATGR